MANSNIYDDISKRTGGDIYIGVVGPVRTGKSTFIKRFMDTLVIPNIPEEFEKQRANDELPQSSGGRTIMTTEPKFIPENAVKISLDGSASFKVRLIDCVGYIVKNSLGYIEDDAPRMVATPWSDSPIPFDKAAEIGTKKVICEHSTIGLVITTDGSIGDIDREDYIEPEERVINELKDINKPFIVLLNSKNPSSNDTIELASELSYKYQVTVIPVNCQELNEDDIRQIIARILFEFPINEVRLLLPNWVNKLPMEHWVRKDLFDITSDCSSDLSKIRDIKMLENKLYKNSYISSAKTVNVDLGRGTAEIDIEYSNSLFYKIIGETTGVEIENDGQLLEMLTDFSKIKHRYEKIKNALDEVEATGYGIVMPSIEELSLEEPQIVRQGGRYGVRLKASAPSIHMMRADITTEVSPIVGSEKQSEDLVMYLLKEFEEDPVKIWDSNIFGKSLHELVNEGLRTKLARMPGDARARLQETLERVINEGCSGLICIIL